MEDLQLAGLQVSEVDMLMLCVNLYVHITSLRSHYSLCSQQLASERDQVHHVGGGQQSASHDPLSLPAGPGGGQ